MRAMRTSLMMVVAGVAVAAIATACPGQVIRLEKKATVQPHQDVLRTDYAPPMFTLADPDGNTVVLIEDEEPAPHGG